MRLNERGWAQRLTTFVDEQTGIGGSDVHCVERNDDGTALRFAPGKIFTDVSEAFFDSARAHLGPAVTVTQEYGRGSRAPQLYFDVRAPTDAQADAVRSRRRHDEKLLATTTPPLWALGLGVALVALALLALAYDLYHHWAPHEDPTMTLRACVAYHAAAQWARVSSWFG